jgi:hypothetical protein
MRFAIALAGALLAVGLSGPTACAQLPKEDARTPAEIRDGEQRQEYGPSYAPRPEPLDIIHQKAQARSYQRMARMASMQWHGMSNSRPTASPMPFTTVYSPGWQMPGGRPYAWYQRGWGSSTIVVPR